MNRTESALTFDCDGDRLVGILHAGDRPDGVVVVTGGPQYRVGSHRQFVHLARRLGAEGFPVLRFDYRGMGDSEGEFAGFEMIADDIRAAIDELLRLQPHVSRVFLWGLCDAASAVMMNAATDSRIRGLALLNPWVRTEAGEAKAVLTHYYGRRLISAEFWKSLFTGRISIRGVLKSLTGLLARLRPGQSIGNDGGQPSFQERMECGMTQFRGPVLLVISGDDLTAAEFMSSSNASAGWRKILSREELKKVDVPDANHTFSRNEWRTAVEDATLSWLKTQATEKSSVL